MNVAFINIDWYWATHGQVHSNRMTGRVSPHILYSKVQAISNQLTADGQRQQKRSRFNMTDSVAVVNKSAAKEWWLSKHQQRAKEPL